MIASVQCENLRIIPLGGLGEIGMNCLVLEYGQDRVLIDCGIQFPDAYHAGVELLLPDFSYLFSRAGKLHGVIVTHGHDDHIGGIPFLAKAFEMDVYCTPFPKGLILQKFTEYQGTKPVRYHDISPQQKFCVGPFTFHPISVQHSIIESLAFAIETPLGTIIHTGDFKHDPHEVNGQIVDFKPFKEWGKRGVALLLSDSTNAEKDGHTLSEIDITRSFRTLLGKQKGRIIIALFASNIRRIENLLSLSHSMKKRIVLLGRSMHAYLKLAHEQRAMNIPEDTLLVAENIQKHAEHEIVVLATGSQAEPGSALVRIAEGKHKEIQIKPGDLVILSSRFIPGNERAITSMIDQLYRLGADVIYESIENIHVSGHGFKDELILMLRACQPQFFVPIHGEYRHLARHSHIAQSVGVEPSKILTVEDGQVLEFNGKELLLCEKLALQKTAVIEDSLLEGNSEVFAQKAKLSRNGVVLLTLIRDRETFELKSETRLQYSGLLFRRGESEASLVANASSHVEAAYREKPRRTDLQEHLRIELRRFFKRRLGYKPVVICRVNDI